MPERVATLPYHAFHPLGVERRRAETVRLACRHARRLEEAATLATAEAHRRLDADGLVGFGSERGERLGGGDWCGEDQPCRPPAAYSA